MTPEPTEQEMLVAACSRLGWKQVGLNGHVFCGMNPKDLDAATQLENVEWDICPDLLHSLDAHFAPGSTVEHMRNKGWEIQVYSGTGGEKEPFGCLFIKPEELAARIYGYAPTPAMAILKAFLKHES